MKLYRFGNYFYNKNFPLVPKLVDGAIRIIHNCAVFSETNIGKGTEFGYGGIGVVIHKRVVIGNDCMVGTNVTIGGRSKSLGVPIIGDNVFIATGAKILGDINIGSNCVIGANSVVITDIPDNCMAAGIPAKVLKTGIVASDFF
jgi:serine O-acetyltransferase